MSEDWPVPTRASIEAAARRVGRLVSRTPLVRSPWLSGALRADVWLKLEVAQTTGSFKVRGAVNALALLKERSPEVKTVITASAGNHGIALGWAAPQFGLRARVFLPVTAPAAKRRALSRLDADLVETATYDAAEAAARADAVASGNPYISPYNHPDVIAGAGTVALEMLEERPDLDAFVVPLGGGGLLAGTALVARSWQTAPRKRPAAQTIPDMLLIGAEPEASPVFTTALKAGHTVPVEIRPTLADGLAGNMEPGSRTFDIVRDLVDRVVLVDESSIKVAMRGLDAHEHVMAEGAAATAVGALLQLGSDLAGRRIGVVLSGRNVDADVFRRVLGPA